MKPVHFVALLTLLAAVGCSKKQSSSEATPSTAPETLATTSTKPAAGPRTIQISGGDNMKFTVTRIEATPGEDLKVVLDNAGSMPKAAMAHNFVLLKAGSDPQAYAGAAVMAKASDYIPPALNDQVIVHTKLLGPKESDEITFKAPTNPGEYPFLCSFPAHFITMKGMLVVK